MEKKTQSYVRDEMEKKTRSNYLHVFLRTKGLIRVHFATFQHYFKLFLLSFIDLSVI